MIIPVEMDIDGFQKSQKLHFQLFPQKLKIRTIIIERSNI